MNRKTAYALLGALALIFVATVGIAVGMSQSDSTPPKTAAPKCSDIWVEGETLPADYAGSCVDDDGTMSIGMGGEACDNGEGLYPMTYNDRMWAVPGEKVQVSQTDDIAEDDAYGDYFWKCASDDGEGFDTDSDTDVTEDEAPEYSTLDVGETREGLAVSSTVASFEPAEPGPDAEQGVDYYIAAVKQCVHDGEPMLLSAMDFYVASPNGNTFDLGMNIQFGDEVTGFGPEYEQREIRQGCNAGDILVKVPSGTKLSKIVLADPLGGDVAEWAIGA